MKDKPEIKKLSWNKRQPTLDTLFEQRPKMCTVCGEDPESGALAHIDGQWLPARPVNYRFRSFRERLRQAWDVFTGKADAKYWPGGQ